MGEYYRGHQPALCMGVYKFDSMSGQSPINGMLYSSEDTCTYIVSFACAWGCMLSVPPHCCHHSHQAYLSRLYSKLYSTGISSSGLWLEQRIHALHALADLLLDVRPSRCDELYQILTQVVPF